MPKAPKKSKFNIEASSNWYLLKKALNHAPISPPDFRRKKRQKKDSGNVDIFSFLPTPEHFRSSGSLGGGSADGERLPAFLKLLDDMATALGPRPSDKRNRKDIPPLLLPRHEPARTNIWEIEEGYKNSRPFLRSMALGLDEKFSDKQRLPGGYLSLDCEMVGVGINASESSLARVSIVNYHGVVIIDEYVKQRERVVDYRTRWSGIRPLDLKNAKPFEEVQKTVNDLLDGRILIGHAVHNDLKALLLSHPTQQTRDTQSYAYKFGLSKSRLISLKKLSKQELGVDIQCGEHSSVVDARTTMAVYRLHMKDWERASGIPRPQRESMPAEESSPILGDWDTEMDTPPTADVGRKKRAKTKGSTSSFPSGGSKGVSSGLSTVVRRREVESKAAWWNSLPSEYTS